MTATLPKSDHDRPRSSAARAQPHPMAAFWTLLRFMAARDRVRAPVWILSLVGIFAGSTASMVGLYETDDELQSYADTAQADAALKALTGPGYGLDEPTQGAVVMNEMGLYTLIAIAMLAIFFVVRHTRAEEDTDRAELVRAAPVGRMATLAAASLWVASVLIVTAIGLTLSLLAFGLPTAGAVAFGASTAGTGLMFLGVAAVTTQMASTARAATAFAAATVGGSFLLRAVGDLGNGWVSWLSPLGWAQGIRAFADERWWVLALMAVTTAGLAAGADFLSYRRDLGAGLLKPRPGPATGNPRLASPLALAVRLQRASVIGWTLGVATLGFFFGIVADQADELTENDAVSDLLNRAGTGTPAEQFLAYTVFISALIASGFTVSSVLRLRNEEIGGRVEPVLAMGVPRTRWLASFSIVAAAGTLLVMTATGLAIGIGSAIQLGDASEILPMVAASWVMVPAMLVLGAVAIAIIGLRPQLHLLAWFGVAMAAIVGLLASSLNLPAWSQDLSPFEHVPAMPAASFSALPLVVLSALAVSLFSTGVWAVRRRDINAA